MNIVLDYSSDLPMYEQIERSIKTLIINGQLKENDMLPSVRGLSKELNVSTITIKRAYLDLEKEGITYSVSGVGTFIKLKNNKKLLKENREKLYEELKELIDKLIECQCTKEEIQEKINKFLKEY